MKFIYTLLLLCTFSTYAQHTFSIVAVDTATGEIGSAGATCLDQEDGALAISDIILNTGAIHTQAFYLPQNQQNARARMVAGDSPQEIIDWLIENDVAPGTIADRQYGIVDLNNGSPRSAAYTGDNAFDEQKHIAGPNYAIQGNILISDDVIDDMETAFVDTDGTLAVKLMAAMQAAKRPGADIRCNTGQYDGAELSSASAFIRVADPTDTNSAYGQLSLDLNVWINGDISTDPIDLLQTEFDLTLGTTNEDVASNIALHPNPVTSSLKVDLKNGVVADTYTIYDLNGRVVVENTVVNPHNRIFISTENLSNGLYIINLYNGDVKLATEKFVVKK